MGNKSSTSMANETLSTSQSLAKDNMHLSNDSYIIILDNTYYSCSWDSEWILINNLGDTELEYLTDDDVSHDSGVDLFTGDYFRAKDVDRDIFNIEDKLTEGNDWDHEKYDNDQDQNDVRITDISTKNDDNHRYTMSPLEKTLNMSPIEEFTFEGFAKENFESSNDQSNEESEDEPEKCIDVNVPLVIDECLEVFKQLSLVGIVNRNRC